MQGGGPDPVEAHSHLESTSHYSAVPEVPWSALKDVP